VYTAAAKYEKLRVYGVPVKYEALCVYRVPEYSEELRMYKVPVKVPVLQWGTVHLDNDINNVIVGFH
jgi:hypothetical protein